MRKRMCQCLKQGKALTHPKLGLGCEEGRRQPWGHRRQLQWGSFVWAEVRSEGLGQSPLAQAQRSGKLLPHWGSRFRQGRLSPASVTFQYVVLSKAFNFCKSCCLIYKKSRLFLILQGCEKLWEIMCTIHKGPDTEQALKRKLLFILKELFIVSRGVFLKGMGDSRAKLGSGQTVWMSQRVEGEPSRGAGLTKWDKDIRPERTRREERRVKQRVQGSFHLSPRIYF